MAVLFIDGFDKYGPAGIAGTPDRLVSEWTVATNNSSIQTALSSTGHAVGVAQGNLSKTLPGDFNRLIGGVRFKSNLGDAAGIALSDGNATQFSINIDAGTGTISISGRSALINRTVTFSVKANSIHYLEWDVTIGAAGAYFVYIDGIVIFSGNALTNGGSGRNSANQFSLTANNVLMIFDDLYVFDPTGTTNNAVLLTNPRIETQFPIADSVKAFPNSGAILGEILPVSADPSGDQIFHNQLLLIQHTPGSNMTLNSIVLGVASSPIENWTAVVYSDSGGEPNALLAQSVDTEGYIGQPFQIDLATPLNLTAGTPYWLGALYKTDISINTFQRINVSVTDNQLSGKSVSRTYSLGPPTTAPSMAIAQPTYLIYGLCTGVAHNWVSGDRNPPPGDLSSISSSTPGNEDLYVFPNLTTHPTAIYTVAVKSYVKLTDTGNRSADLRMKSGTTDSNGSFPGQIPSTSYEWIESFFDTDPNTDSGWTEAGLNAAVSGIKVVT